MNLPKIDLAALPDLDTLTGVFGSMGDTARALAFDDIVLIVMVYLYDVIDLT